ncbi:type IV conjugative transfer system pilin TraA [Pantoea sp. M_9]|uniref:type IV conjugative transfer system pilin TraA n=1 Tax=Pantoea sp. M_9 TaxID=2608041 RepID=UPI001231B910|nr:type IV conjugative transfer system pilin TraA [Pantoea sp. M_9]KAA5971655.1 type IV conjugative transfer system pilin TraA [Pantoea sp. M_9]
MNFPVNGAGLRTPQKVKAALANKGMTLMNRSALARAARYALAPLLVLIAATGTAGADDLLAGGKQTVDDTFGANSSIAVWIVLGEVIFGVIGYIRTKNIMLLFGVAVVVVFTTVGFSLAS